MEAVRTIRCEKEETEFFKRQDGFTLVEMLVSISVSSFVMAGLFMLLTQSFSLWKKTEFRTDVQQSVQAVAEEMSWDIRRATNNARYPVIIQASPPAVRFYYVDVPTNYTFVQYRYSSSDKKIYRDSIVSPTTKPTELQWSGNTSTWTNNNIVADNITTLSFSPSSYTFTGAYNQERSFRINVAVERASKSLASGKESTNIYTKVNLRNF